MQGEEQMSTAIVINGIGEPLTEELEGIFRDHYAMVYRTAYSLTGSPQDAEDIVQSLFLQLLRLGFPSGLSDNPKAYLYRATVNLSLNAVKSRRRQILVGDVESLESPPVPAAPGPDPEIRRRLLDAMAQLHPRSVEILILHYEHSYSDAQIGKLLGTSRGVIAVTLHRARARLKKLLDASSQSREKKP
jgi:RNA polymerase sigma-70 factor (ECF subfamily)